MLSFLQIKAIKLTKRLFFYLPANLYEWDIAKGRFNWVYTSKRSVYARIQFFNIICLSIQSFFSIWLYLNNKIETNYSTILLIQHSLIAAESIPVIAIEILAVLNYQQFEYINALVKFRHQLFQGLVHFIIELLSLIK